MTQKCTPCILKLNQKKHTEIDRIEPFLWLYDFWYGMKFPSILIFDFLVYTKEQTFNELTNAKDIYFLSKQPYYGGRPKDLVMW